MKVTKKEQWAPITIELESVEELKLMGNILVHVIVTMRSIEEPHRFACKFRQKLREVNK